MIQQYYYSGLIQRNVSQDPTETLAHRCLLQHYSQQPSFGNDSCPTTNEWIKKKNIYIHTHTHTHTQP
jgi:hypothetical protein